MTLKGDYATEDHLNSNEMLLVKITSANMVNV
jgi:hypothetical protein